jgi:hypothetical protein
MPAFWRRYSAYVPSARFREIRRRQRDGHLALQDILSRQQLFNTYDVINFEHWPINVDVI